VRGMTIFKMVWSLESGVWSLELKTSQRNH
jgi:hypothetical protein